MREFFETLQGKYGEGSAHFLGDHPNPDNRSGHVGKEILLEICSCVIVDFVLLQKGVHLHSRFETNLASILTRLMNEAPTAPKRIASLTCYGVNTTFIKLGSPL
jgi:hypothetical protein